MQQAIIYARYSSHAQRDASIDQQIAACKAYAQRSGLEIMDVYTDRALTGTNDKRPGFRKMIADAQKQKWQYVIVYAMDRFSRDRYDAATNKHKLKEAGVKVLSATEPISDDPLGVVVESMLEGYAEYYSLELSRKVRRGHADNAKKGIVNGPLPLGYRRGPDGKPEIDPPNAAIVREIFHRVAQGDSLADISADLNARGLRTKTGNPWGKSSYNQILANERYTGLYIYQDVRIPGGIPAILTQEEFSAVQQRLAYKKNPRRTAGSDTPVSRRRADGVYLLTGKLFCGGCGAPYVGVSGTARDGTLRHYYACRGRIRENNGCTAKNVPREAMERDIAQIIKTHILNEPTIQAIAQASYDYQLQAADTSDLPLLQQQLADTNRSIKNIMSAIEAGIFTTTTRDRLQELEAQQRTLTARIASIQSAAQDLPTKEELAAMLRHFSTGDIADPAYQEALIDAFLVRAYVFPDRYELYFSPDAKTAVAFPLDFQTATAPQKTLFSGAYNAPELRPIHVIRSAPTIICIAGLYRITLSRPSH